MFWLEIKVPGESVPTHQIHVFPHISPLPCCSEDEGEKQEELGRDQLEPAHLHRRGPGCFVLLILCPLCVQG